MGLFIQDAWAQGAAGPADPLLSMLPLVLVFVVFYFFLIRPQSKRQKEHKEMVAKLAVGRRGRHRRRRARQGHGDRATSSCRWKSPTACASRSSATPSAPSCPRAPSRASDAGWRNELMNRNPWWKNLLIGRVIMLSGLLVALPNFFGEDPALQIGLDEGRQARQAELEEVKRTVAAANIRFARADPADKVVSWSGLLPSRISSRPATRCARRWARATRRR